VDPSLPTIHSVLELGQPNHVAIHNGRVHRTNSLGVRGPEYTLEPAPDVFRIVIAGDSVTMGAGVDEADAYPQVLSRLLEGRSERWRYEVINLGVSGLNIGTIVGRLRNIGLRYHPHLLVYGFTPNDIEGPAYRIPARPPDPLADQKRYDRLLQSPSYLVRMAGPRLLALRDRFDPPEGSYFASSS
jgi:lysophospholipase L1-like esterase